MVDLNIVLDAEPVNTPDAEVRLRNAWRILAEMVLKVVEGERDNRETPGMDLPLVSDAVSSPADNNKVLEV